MDKIRYGKSVSWVAPVGVVLGFFALITAQPEFLSISCGGKTSHTAENNITSVVDAPYIDVGQAADNTGGVSELGSYLHTMRYIPKPLNKSCYQLPVTPDVPHLLWFSPGNYNGYEIWPDISFAFMPQNTPVFYEYILFTTGRVVYICLVRTSEDDDPYISAIEMRRLQDGMYQDARIGLILVTLSRCDAGGNSTVRDLSGRNLTGSVPSDFADSTSLDLLIEESDSTLPPIINTFYEFMAIGGSDFFDEFMAIGGSDSFDEDDESEIGGSDSFEEDDEDDEDDESEIGGSDSFDELMAIGGSDSFDEDDESEMRLSDDQPTYSQSIDPLNDIKEWTSGDPCYLLPRNSIVCDYSSGQIRISEIDLSGRNLPGSVPSDFAKLTSLVNLLLDHNHLAGPMPNLANLTRLERLYLQNNNLNGTVEWLSGLISLQELSLDHNQFTGPMPNLANLYHLERLYLQNNKLNGNVDWLSDLTNLREINIENNNFSGAFPPQLLLDCSLKLKYSGNPYLRIGKRECNLQKKHTKLVVVLGILFIALMVDKFIKLSIKKERVPRGTEEEAIDKDRSMNMVPNATKSRAFTVNEMTAATQSFSREIGRGGFGSVFFGKLPHGKLIAVKVLSLFSRQGIHEFLNEVDLLSKINHRNLVSLLGYCNETDEVMLVYEHMSGGSLRDHLYGPQAENSDLNWKRRLKVALDAAQGLEYLHVGCAPKIIHRDVKTANILLDSNLNGKLADFGLSRIIADEEGTHVTTTVKGTFGYLDPEYYNTQMLTEKSDVYSFGVVLLEIISGRPPIDINLAEEDINIVRWVTPYLLEMDGNGGQISEIIDKRFCGGYDMKSISNIAKIAMRCVHALPSCRPTMSEIVTELKEAIKVEEDKDCISIAEENGIENGDISTTREGMEWNDNSSNMPNVGR